VVVVVVVEVVVVVRCGGNVNTAVVLVGGCGVVVDFSVVLVKDTVVGVLVVVSGIEDISDPVVVVRGLRVTAWRISLRDTLFNIGSSNASSSESKSFPPLRVWATRSKSRAGPELAFEYMIELNKFSINSSIGVLEETRGACVLGCFLLGKTFVLFFVSL